MLREIEAQQFGGKEPRRRWFMSTTMDLIVWFNPDDEVIGFQLCYDKSWKECTVIWKRSAAGDETVMFAGISTGADSWNRDAGTPLVVGTRERPDYDDVLVRYTHEAALVPQELSALVRRVLLA
jgi:hypothetical protein